MTKHIDLSQYDDKDLFVIIKRQEKQSCEVFKVNLSLCTSQLH